MAQPLHAHTILSSPLWHRETVRKDLLPAPSVERLKEKEERFRLDCILVERLRYKWSADIIPKYDAMRDPYARHYFKSPMVQSLLRRTLEKEGQAEDTPSSPRSRNSTKPGYRSELTLKSPRHQPHNQQTPSPSQLHQSSPSSRLSINTLSGRHRAPAPPTEAALVEREDRYCIDSVVATNQVTKYKPLIRPYDATEDRHTRDYFRKPGVRRVLAITVGAAGPARRSGDVCKDKGGCSIDGPVIDRFIVSGAGYRYLHARNGAPGAARAGHSTDQINGHGQFMSDAKAMFGFNGEYGYRRNTPWLRKMPSSFGVDQRSPTH